MRAASDPAPDAGNTVLGHYTLLNPMVVWLLSRSPELLAEESSALIRSDVRPPRCPRAAAHPLGQDAVMRWRPGEWVCYQHEEPVREPIEAKYESAPNEDVLSLVDKVLDWQWDDEAGRHVMKMLDSPADLR